jgi:hypothetical protein
MLSCRTPAIVSDTLLLVVVQFALVNTNLARRHSEAPRFRQPREESPAQTALPGQTDPLPSSKNAVRSRPAGIPILLSVSPKPRAGLQSSFAPLVIANADGLVDAREKNLPVPNLARASRSDDGLHSLLYHSIHQNNFQLGFRN